jgi:Low psii accumulation1 / Rep27
MTDSKVSLFLISANLVFSLLTVTNAFNLHSLTSVVKGFSPKFRLPANHIICRKSSVFAKKFSDAADDTSSGSKPADPTPSTEVEKAELKEEMRVKLKDEISSPFRKVRQFIYSGMGIAGTLGTVTALPQLLFAIQDGGDAIGGAVANVGIDIGTVVLAYVLWDKDAQAEKIKLERYTKKEKLLTYQMSATDKEDRERELSLLPVQIQISEKDENATRIVSLGELQSKGKQNVIIVAGKRDFVKDAVISAKIEGADLFNSKEIYVVPVVLEDDQLEAAMAKGFGAAKESLMGAPYIGKPTQVSGRMSKMYLLALT